ncbi:unnamed protein product, partial [Ectocarpus fasciculatus]
CCDAQSSSIGACASIAFGFEPSSHPTHPVHGTRRNKKTRCLTPLYRTKVGSLGDAYGEKPAVIRSTWLSFLNRSFVSTNVSPQTPAISQTISPEQLVILNVPGGN